MSSANYSMRGLLKRPNHSLLSSIRDLLILRSVPPTFVKVKAHVGIVGNEMADRLAHSATKMLNYSDLPSSTRIFKSQDGKVVDIPTRQFAKLVFCTEQTRLVTCRIQRNFSYLQLNVPLVLRLMKLIPKHTSLHTFMMKHLAFQLPTSRREFLWATNAENALIQNATCRRCHLYQESEFHLWNCDMNDKNQVKEDTLVKATRRFSSLATSLPPLPFLIDFFFDCDPFFSQGLISAEAVRRFSTIPTTISCGTKRQLVQTNALLLCYLSFNEAFHSLVWTERNAIHHSQDPVVLQVTPLHDPPPISLDRSRKRQRDQLQIGASLPPLTMASKQIVSSRFCFKDPALSIPLPPTLPAALSAPVANP